MTTIPLGSLNQNSNIVADYITSYMPNGIPEGYYGPQFASGPQLGFPKANFGFTA